MPGTATAYHREREAELERQMAKERQYIDWLSGRADNVLVKLNESSARQAAAEAELRSVDARLAVAEARLASIQRRLDTLTAEMLAKTAEIETTQGEVDERTAILDGRVAQMYKTAPDVIVSMVRIGQDFTDMMTASAYAERIVEMDRVLLDEIEAAKARLEAQRAELEAKRAVVREQHAAARATADQIAAERAQRAGVLATIQREVNYQDYLLGELRSKKKHHQAILRRMERESQEIAEFLRGEQSGQDAIQGRGGWLKWPVSGNITSDYGWRTHPVYGGRNFHTGIDIGAGQGTTVRSARIGKVIMTGYYGGYGLVVIVDHGSSVATMYCHLSQTYVSEGEHVATQQAIAAVGSTGYSTGPHLHFEVRVNGNHTDPKD
jgi:murein DD-endopeptidase MepM/ murein hydrolase activator NlpD